MGFVAARKSAIFLQEHFGIFQADESPSIIHSPSSSSFLK